MINDLQLLIQEHITSNFVYVLPAGNQLLGPKSQQLVMGSGSVSMRNPPPAGVGQHNNLQPPPPPGGVHHHRLQPPNTGPPPPASMPHQNLNMGRPMGEWGTGSRM